MPNEVAIRIEDLSLRYRVSVESRVTLKNAIMRAGRREKRRVRTIEAIKNSSLATIYPSITAMLGSQQTLDTVR